MYFKSIRIITACALLLGCSLSLPSAGPATAAEDGSGLSTGRRTYEPLIAAYEGVEGQIQALRSVALELRRQADALQTLATEADEADAADAAQAADMVEQIDSAQEKFVEIAVLLSTELVKQVQDELSRRRDVYVATSVYAEDNHMLRDEAAQVQLALASIEELIAPLEEAAKQGKSTPVTRSNISNN